MPRSGFALSVAYLFGFALAIAAVGQDAKQEPTSPTLKADVREVLVPVVVTDKSGHYVADLGRDDFSVFEDGVPQKIVAFSRSSVSASVAQAADGPSRRAPAVSPRGTVNDSPKRTYLICLDNLHSAFEDFARVRKALAKFFAEEQAGDSQYALVALGWKLHVVVDSTRDPATILAAIDSKSLLKTIRDSETRNLASETDRFVGLVGHWCANCYCTSPTRDMTGPNYIGCPGLKGQVRADLLTYAERASGLNQNFLQQLTQLVSAMSTMPTRRTVVFLSDGFNRFAGQELYGVLKAYGVGDTSFKFNSHDLQPQLDGILKLAVRHDIRFYTIDSRGLYTGAEVPGSGMGADSAGGGPSAVRHEEMSVAWFNGDAMSELAKQTGGQFFENNNDLLKGIRRAFADGREEYVLAYVPSNTAVDAQFRRITVQLKDKKLQIAAKAGYWASP
jgi:VWFA-related protein